MIEHPSVPDEYGKAEKTYRLKASRSLSNNTHLFRHALTLQQHMTL